MADKDFVVKNGIVVNSSLIYATGGQVGINTTSLNSTLTVAGTANVSGNVALGNNLVVAGNSTLASVLATTVNSTSINATTITTSTVNATSVNSATINATSTIVVGGAVTLNTTTLSIGGATVNSTVVNATSFSGTAANATYLNSQLGSYYLNYSNMNAGTVGAAYLPQANSTANGSVILVDSVTNSAVSAYAPTLNSVATTYTAAIAANTRAASAQSAAVSSYTNAVAYIGTLAYVNTSQLSSNLALYTNSSTLATTYAALSGANFTGNINTTANVTANSLTVTTNSAIANLVVSNFATIAGGNVTGNLQVVGNLIVNGSLQYTANSTGNIIPSSNSLSLGNSTAVWHVYASDVSIANGMTVSGPNSNFNSGLLYLDTLNRRVGVGNTSPNSALTVNGVIETTNSTIGIKFGDGSTMNSATLITQAYNNAIAFAANASTINSGSISPSILSLTPASTTQYGAVIMVDSVTNSAIATYSPTMNSVATAYTAALAANTRANSAQSAVLSAQTWVISNYVTNSYLNSTYSNSTSIAATYVSNSAANGIIAAYLPNYTGSVNATSYLAGNSTSNSQINSTALLMQTGSLSTNLTSNGLVVGLALVNSTFVQVGNGTVNSAIGLRSATGLYSLVQSLGQVNSSVEMSVSNYQNGTNSSSDFIAYDSSGITGGNYVDLGINGNTFSQPSTWTINGPSDGYLYTSNGNMAIGVAGANSLSFFAGGTLANNEVFRINNGNFFFGVNSAIYANGSIGQPGQVLTTNSTGQVYWANSVASGLSGNSISVGNSTVNSVVNSIMVSTTIGYQNQNTFTTGSYTTPVGFNTMIVGPYTIATGNSIVVTTGTRLVII